MGLKPGSQDAADGMLAAAQTGGAKKRNQPQRAQRSQRKDTHHLLFSIPALFAAHPWIFTRCPSGAA